MTTTVETLLAQVRRDSGVQFIPTRYPYTYACDFIRCHPDTVPDEVVHDFWPSDAEGALSRAQASKIRREWARFENRDDDDLARVLADAYLAVNGIVKAEASDAR